MGRKESSKLFLLDAVGRLSCACPRHGCLTSVTRHERCRVVRRAVCTCPSGRPSPVTPTSADLIWEDARSALRYHSSRYSISNIAGSHVSSCTLRASVPAFLQCDLFQCRYASVFYAPPPVERVGAGQTEWLREHVCPLSSVLG